VQFCQLAAWVRRPSCQTRRVNMTKVVGAFPFADVVFISENRHVATFLVKAGKTDKFAAFWLIILVLLNFKFFKYVKP